LNDNNLAFLAFLKKQKKIPPPISLENLMNAYRDICFNSRENTGRLNLKIEAKDMRH
jgi:hypothetical protein